MKEHSRYERQYILKEIGREGQRLLEKSTVAVVGLGALGSVSANLFARAGVGSLILIDRDYLEINNLQRQVLYDEEDLRRNLPKAVAAKRKLSGINSEINVRSEVADVNASTIGELLSGADLVIDGTDNFETRFLLNDYSLKHKIPWIYGGAIRTEGMAYVVLPKEGPCLRCLFGQAPSSEETQTCDQVGILAPVAHMIASFQAVEGIKLLARQTQALERRLWKIDIWSREFRAVSVEHLKETPCSGCKNGDYPYLESRQGSSAVTLCGRNAVQINHAGAMNLKIQDIAKKLPAAGEIMSNEYLLRYRIDHFELTLFQNGRAIVKGTEDLGQAKSLYAKYIGI